MKYLGGTLAVLLLLATAMGFVCYRLGSAPLMQAAAQNGDAMAWLRADFHLTEAQFTEIRKLHDAYAPSCEEHCRLIREATKVRAAIKATGGADPAAVAAAERTLQELRITCETAITVHVQKVAALMSPADGRRYLDLVLPKIANFDHKAAPNLQLNHAH